MCLFLCYWLLAAENTLFMRTKFHLSFFLLSSQCVYRTAWKYLDRCLLLFFFTKMVKWIKKEEDFSWTQSDLGFTMNSTFVIVFRFVSFLFFFSLYQFVSFRFGLGMNNKCRTMESMLEMEGKLRLTWAVYLLRRLDFSNFIFFFPFSTILMRTIPLRPHFVPDSIDEGKKSYKWIELPIGGYLTFTLFFLLICFGTKYQIKILRNRKPNFLIITSALVRRNSYWICKVMKNYRYR